MERKNVVKHFVSYITESGRTLVEVMAVLAVIGVLSVGGFWLFDLSNQERQINDIIYHMNIQVAQIYPALDQNAPFGSEESLNRFLAPYQKQVGDYLLTFQADSNVQAKDFIVQITRADGNSIKGKMCRNLISKMSQLKVTRDVSFTLKDEEMEDGSVADVTIPLKGRVIDFKALCG